MASSGGAGIGGIIGAIIGSFIPGVGPAMGYAIGSFIGGVVSPAVVDGPRLSDLRVQNSTYGGSEAICYGGVRLAGNVIWSTDLVESESQGGGKGGTETNVFSYTVSCAINICAGQVESIRRIWGDSKLVYDATDTATTEALAASAAFGQFFVFYTGTEGQLPDPTIEATLGVGNVPGYRGSAYIVFTDLPLEGFGNRIPSFSFEISTGVQEAACDLPGAINDFVASTNLSPPTLGIVNLTWSAVSGATHYDIYMSANGGPPEKLNATPHLTTLFQKNRLTGGVFWTLGASYVFYAVAVNDCGSTPSNAYGTRWYGTFNGAGEYYDNADWAPLCLNYWAPDSYGYGGGNFSDICFRVGEGTQQVSSYFGMMATPGDPSLNVDGTVGIVPLGSALLSDIITDIGERCGLESARNDVSALTAIIVDGYIVSRQMAGRTACEPLQSTYFVDAVESGNSIRWVLRGGAPLVAIGYDDLGAQEGNAEESAVAPLRAQETDLPSRVNVSYMSRARDYETGAQTERRMTTGSQQMVSIELPIVISDLKAKQVASVLMYNAWTARNKRRWNTTRKYAQYEPTDVVTLDDGEFIYTVRIVEKSEEGAVIKWIGVDDSVAAYSPNVVAATGTGSSIIRFFGGVMRLELLDVPLVRDEDSGPGYYAAAGGMTDAWAGGIYYRSLDAGASYAVVDNLVTTATLGDAQSVLNDFSGGNTVDEQNTVSVRLTSGTLSSITQAQLLNGGNLAVLGDEIIQFKRVELLTTDTYILSGLLRGRRGTEQHMGTHAVFDRFVLFDSTNVIHETDALSNIGAATLAKGVTFGRLITSTVAESFTDTGASIKPLSVVHLAAVDAGGGSYTVNWIRRSRIGIEWRDGVDVPLGETIEQYSVEVERASAIISTATVTTNTATVAAIDNDIVRVFQISEAAGRGFPAEVTI